jgi:hypothetical protein
MKKEKNRKTNIFAKSSQTATLENVNYVKNVMKAELKMHNNNQMCIISVQSQSL